MGILLCLCKTELLLTTFCKILTKCIGNVLFFECDELVWNCLIVILEAYKCCLNEWSVESCEFIITECTCHFTGTVWTEVKEDDRVIFFYNRQWLSILCDNGRENKLIGYFLCIGVFHSLYSVFSLYTLALCQRIICLLHTIPVVITIHCVITTG